MPDSDPQPVPYRASTPLMEAILLPNEEESVKWVSELLEAGEDPNQYDLLACRYPLEAAWSEAIWTDGRSDAVLRLMLNHGASVNEQLHHDADLELLFINASTDLCLLMLEHGIKLQWLYKSREHEKFTDYFNPLTKMLAENQTEKLEALTPFGILEFIHVFSDLGHQPLHEMIDIDRLDHANWLIQHGADINAHSDLVVGDTPLDRAVEAQSLRAVEFCLNRGANPKIPTWMSITAFQRAERHFQGNKKSNTAKQIFKLVEDASRKHPKFD